LVLPHSSNMAYTKREKGSELEEKLILPQRQQFTALMREYFQEVSRENPALISIAPPYGIKDVKEFLEKVAGGNKVEFDGNCLLAMVGRAYVSQQTSAGVMYEPREVSNVKEHEWATEDVGGFLTFQENGDILYETHMVVGKDFGGKGLGTLLLKDFVQYGKSNGFREVRIYNFTVGGYATFRKVERELNDLTLAFENVSTVRFGTTP